MSTESYQKSETSLPLNREQLLEALDKDIETIATSQSAAGWNHWAILGALAALLWSVLNAWEHGDFTLDNVLALTLAITVTWDWLNLMATQLDTSPLANIQIGNRFWSLTGLLGSTRTSMVYDLAKKLFFLIVVFHLKSPFLIWLRIYYCFDLLGSVIGLMISYLDEFPEISHENKYLPHWAVRSILVFNIIMPAVAGVFAWGYIWINANRITTNESRMSLMLSALIYLMLLAIRNRIPTHFLNAYRTIRRNLAYGHISLEEARNQSDIISIGGTLDQTLSLHLKKVLNATESAEVALHCARQKVVDFSDSVVEWANLPDAPETKEKQSKSVAQQKEFFIELDKASKLLEKAENLLKNFEARFDHLTSLSRGPIKSVERIFEQMKAKSKEMEATYKQVKGLLDLTHQVIKAWRDENTLKETLAKFREVRGGFGNTTRKTGQKV